jgi:DNA polymerase I-like protein with 3'-5' exonuclease and polymerase domains
MFEFQNEVNEKKFKDAKDIDPVLYESNHNNQDFYVLVDSPLPSAVLNKLKKFISLACKGKDYTIISALPFVPKEKDLKKKIFDLYGMNGTKLSNYIKPNSKVLTIGRALYGITKGDDLSIEGFYDTITWETSFYSPEIKSHIFPCPYLFSWLDKDTFERFFTFKQLEFIVTDVFRVKRVQKPDLIYLDTQEKCNQLLNNRIAYTDITSFDLETKRLNPWSNDGKIICLTLCFIDEPHKSYFLPYNLIDTHLLNAFFSNKKLIGNNIKYDIKWLVVKGNIDRNNLSVYWDNMKSSHAINELQFNSLKSDAWLYTPYGGYDFPLEEYKSKFPACGEDYSLIPTEILFPYATMDACVSMLCYMQHQEEIDKLDKLCPLTNGWSIRRSLVDVAFPAIDTFTDIELEGMSYDWNKLTVLSGELQQEIVKRKKELYQVLNMPDSVNIDSGDQLGKFLESKGWENPGRSKKGLYLTNDSAMVYWKRKGHKEVDLLREYTEYNTVMKTFVGVEKNEKGVPTGFYQYRAVDNKIHGSYRTMMADTWRGKSYDPNLQNIIKMSTTYLGNRPFTDKELEEYRKESKKIKVERDGKLISIDSKNIQNSDKNPIPLHIRVRECFTVPSGDYVLSENDGKGLQLRVATSYSHDPVMTDIFLNRGGDMHSITGREIFAPNVSIDYFIAHKNEQPYKTYRKKAKSCFYKNTQILTNKGFIPIEKLCNTDYGIFKWKDNTIKTIGRDNKEKEIYTSYRALSTETIKFTLENNDIIEVTPNHIMIVIRNDKEIRIEASQVLQTDEIVNFQV